MLTPDELAAIPFFAALSPVALADVGRAAADIRLNAGEYAVYEGETAGSLRRARGIIEVIKLVDGIERKIGTRLPGKIFGEVPLVFGTPVSGRLPSRRADASAETGARGPITPSRPLRPSLRGRWTNRLASVSADCRRLRRSRPALGSSCSETVGMAPASTFAVFLSATRSPSPGSRRTTPISPTIGPGRRRRRANARRCGSPDGATLIRPEPREFAGRLGLQTSSALQGLRHGHHWRRTGGSRRRRLRGLGGLAHHRGRAGGAGRSGGDLVADRELSRLSERRSRASELASRALRTGQAPGRRNSRRAQDCPHRSSCPPHRPRRRARSLQRAHRHHRVGRELAPPGRSTASTGCSARAYSTVRREAKRAIAQGLDVHLIGAGNSAGQAAIFFANHARTVTLIVRGQVARKEHVALSHRPDPHQIQHPGRATVRGQGRLRRHPPDGDRHPRPQQRTMSVAKIPADCSSSSALTRRPAGCRPRSRATRAATS